MHVQLVTPSQTCFKRTSLIRLQEYERVGISSVKVYETVEVSLSYLGIFNDKFTYCFIYFKSGIKYVEKTPKLMTIILIH